MRHGSSKQPQRVTPFNATTTFIIIPPHPTPPPHTHTARTWIVTSKQPQRVTHFNATTTFINMPPHPTLPTPHPHSARVTSKQPQRVTPFNATTTFIIIPPHPTHPARDVLQIEEKLYINIQTGHTLSFRADHLRHPQKKIICFCENNVEPKKRDELRQKTGTALKSKLHCAELKKPKNAYEPDVSGSRRFSKKTCPESKQNTGFREGMSFWPTVLSEPVWIYIH